MGELQVTSFQISQSLAHLIDQFTQDWFALASITEHVLTY